MSDQLANMAIRNLPEKITRLRVRLSPPDGPERVFKGRAAWCLGKLLTAGRHGVTAIEAPGARVAHFVFLLRKSGVAIETQSEAHSGTYRGAHARYRLASPLEVLEVEAA